MNHLYRAALALAAAAATAGIIFAQDGPGQSHIADSGIIRSQRLACGMPLGGIGCGTFELMTDGSVSRATINNNFDQPTGEVKGAFASIWTSGGGKVIARALHLKSPYGLPSVGQMEFGGQFPRAVIEYPDRELPVKISLHAYSSLIPHDLKNSSVPAAIFLFRVTNLARGPVDISVALSWENFLGVGGTATEGRFSDRTGNTILRVPVVDGKFGLRMASRLSALRPESRTRYNAAGTYALMAEATSPETVVSMAGWNALDSTPGWWPKFATDGTVEGESGEGVEGRIHPAGVVAMKVPLKDGETRELPFAVAWHTPRHWVSNASEYGHAYERSYSDAVGVARYALESRLASLALTNEWQGALQRSSLPAWLSRKVLNDTATLFQNTILTRDSGLAGTEPGPSLFSILESPGNGTGALGGMDHLPVAAAMQSALFPQLHARLLSQFRAAQAASGEISRILGHVDKELVLPQNGEKVSESERRPDVQCAYTYLVYRAYRMAGDQKFLDEFYPSAKHALQFAATLDTNGDGVPEGGSIYPGASGEAYIASMWRGALRIGLRMAAIMQDRSFAAELNALAAKAQRREEPHPIGTWLSESVGIPNDIQRFSTTDREYAAHSVAYLGALYAGRRKVNEGLDLVKRIDTANWAAGMPWQAPLGISGRSHIANGSSWHFYNALIGFDIDLPDGHLTLAPQLPESMKALAAPIFSPTFTGWMEYHPGARRSTLSFRLDRYIPVATRPVRLQSGVGLTLKKVIVPDNGSRSVTASLGRAPVPGKAAKVAGDRIAFTFETPLKLSAGHRLVFLYR